MNVLTIRPPFLFAKRDTLWPTIDMMSNQEKEPSEIPEASGRDKAVTVWLKSIENGDSQAVTELWNYSFPRLLKHARRKLPDHLKRVLDEEDVALSAFKSFCLAAADGKFSELNSRDDLWKLLLTIAGRKAQHYVRHELRQKRGGGKVRGESIFQSQDQCTENAEAGIGNVVGNDCSPSMMAQFTEDVQQLLEMLKDDTLKAVALLRVEGHSVEAIAKRLNCGKRTIERKLTLIRRKWQETVVNHSNDDEAPT